MTTPTWPEITALAEVFRTQVGGCYGYVAAALEHDHRALKPEIERTEPLSRFDPDTDKPYAICEGCESVLPTREEMSAHLSETFSNGKSHRAQITNPTRPERIERELRQLADNALGEFVDEAWDLTEREGITEEEITEAVRFVVADFDDAWADRNE